MKKIYEKPELTVESFDVEDVITESGLTTVGTGKQSNEGERLNPGDFIW